MDDSYFGDINIPICDYPSDFIPADAELFTAFDLSNGEDHSCVAHFIEVDGVIVLQDFEFYDPKGNKTCR